MPKHWRRLQLNLMSTITSRQAFMVPTMAPVDKMYEALASGASCETPTLIAKECPTLKFCGTCFFFQHHQASTSNRWLACHSFFEL